MNEVSLILIGAIGMGAAIFVGHFFLSMVTSKAKLEQQEAELEAHAHRAKRLVKDIQALRRHAEDRADALYLAKDFIRSKTPPFVNGEWSSILATIENALPKLAITYQPRNLDDEAQQDVEAELSKLLGVKHDRSTTRT